LIAKAHTLDSTPEFGGEYVHGREFIDAAQGIFAAVSREPAGIGGNHGDNYDNNKFLIHIGTAVRRDKSGRAQG
jgi:hypothetical protein